MKKLISILFVACAIVAVSAPEKQADAQVVLYSNRCCDGWGYVRCVINPPAPVGYGCWCYNQGAGVVC